MPHPDPRKRPAKKSPPKRARAFAVNGPVLRALRLSRGWSQQEAADRAGLSDRLLRHAESGRPIELKSIALLAQLYGVPDTLLARKRLPAEPLAAPIESSPPAQQSAAEHEAAQKESIVRRWWEEVWNQGLLEAIEELTTPDCVLHADGKDLHGHDAVRERTQAIRAAFSDIQLRLEQMIVQGDWVISRWHAVMTHSGPWMGAPPTGKRIVVNGSTWMRIANGLLVEGWDCWEQPAITGTKPQRHKDTEKPKGKNPKGGSE